MSARRLRIAVVGATGALGTEVVQVLDARRFPIDSLWPVATDRSLGGEVDCRGESHPVETKLPPFEELDAIFLCTPPEVAQELARKALAASVPAFDLTGAHNDCADVPLVVAELGVPAEAYPAPVVASPAGPSLALALVLAPLERAFGLRRVEATVLVPVSSAGLRGIDALHAETIALFNQGELPEPTVFGRNVAFDCLPYTGAPDAEGHAPAERAIARDLQRVVCRDLRVGATVVPVPTFAGDAFLVSLETARPATAGEVGEVLRDAPSVELCPPDACPTTRATAGRRVVLVDRVRADLGGDDRVLLWLAADTLQLVAGNAVKLAETRLLAS